MKPLRKTLILGMLLSAMLPLLSGCGVAVGAAGAGAGYEYQHKRQMDMLEKDFKAGKIDKQEYLKRRKEIESGSLIY